jgi:TRAP-type mannitol/chloroaromatic compound transport system substrate-binding protein
MKRKIFLIKTPCFLVALITLALLAFPLHSALAKTYRMKIQSAFPRGDLSMELLKDFAESADKKSNGQLKIKVFAEPEIVPGDQLFGATKQGVLTMLHGMGGIWAGVVPIGNVEFNLPLAYKINKDISFAEKAQVLRDFVYQKGIIDILREEYAKHGLYFLDIHTYGPVPFVLSTKDVKDCSDLKGMKIKCDGINRSFHNGVGMVSTDMSPTETYMALKLGTVDAAEWDVSAVTGLKWHEVAPYWVQGMESDHTFGHILVSLKKWNALPDDMKEALQGAAEDYWHATVKGYQSEMDAVQALVDKGELKVSVLSESCQKKYMEAAKTIWKDLAAEDPASAKMIKIIEEWRGITE